MNSPHARLKAKRYYEAAARAKEAEKAKQAKRAAKEAAKNAAMEPPKEKGAQSPEAKAPAEAKSFVHSKSQVEGK